MSDAVLRIAIDADFDALFRLFEELVGPELMPKESEARMRLAEILDHPGTHIQVAEVSGQVAAMATLHVLPNLSFGGRPYALVENVATLKSHQGRGIGRRVMEEIAAFAWSKDAYKIMLLTGRDLGARGFYEKLGYSAEEKYGMTLRRAPKRQPR